MKKQNSIVTPEQKSCAFCDYLNEKRPFTFVFRDADIAIMVTREQRGEPHLLVIPTRHVETLLDISDQEAARLSIGVRDVAKAIEKEYKPSGISVWQNNGTSASQSIGHVHFHVAGTLEEGGTDWGKVPELPLTATEEIAVRLRPYFS
ncbi:hydrolase [Acidovorax sp. SUPP2522]|uniref:HIT family protein n=1 Tax=unclassified Acidovorax TaxID=2684926 RepID=UPI00234BB324|nr:MULTISPECIES: HIT domain-containing protein [unclassified Acidovorax]WCM96106.1 HIT domain-containing protein [Acidovorax sp. GBBC 1281]GKT17389.1 hydrolase [Acidovorax sp. SUPP2522]